MIAALNVATSSVTTTRSSATAASSTTHYGRRGDDLVFLSAQGLPVRRTNWRRRYWDRAVTRAGLAPLRIHDLRHSAVALWIAAGASPTSVVTVLDRYGHLLPGCEDRVNDALDAMARTVVPSTEAAVTAIGTRRKE